MAPRCIVAVTLMAALPLGRSIDGTSRTSGDAVSLLQRSLLPEALDSIPPRQQFEIGDHVLVTILDGTGGPSSSVKGSISGKGAEKDSYNVHLWVGPQRLREKLNVPSDLLADARPLEFAEAWRHQQEMERQEAQRKAEEEARKKAAEEAAREKARKIAEEEDKKRKWEEAQRKAEEEAREKAEKEAAALRAEREEKQRREEEARMNLRRDEEKRLAEEKAAAEKEAKEAAKLQEMTTGRVQFTVKDSRGKTATFNVLKKMPLRAMMIEACDRLHCRKDRVHFYHKKREFKETDTAGQLGIRNDDVLMINSTITIPPPKKLAEH